MDYGEKSCEKNEENMSVVFDKENELFLFGKTSPRSILMSHVLKSPVSTEESSFIGDEFPFSSEQEERLKKDYLPPVVDPLRVVHSGLGIGKGIGLIPSHVQRVMEWDNLLTTRNLEIQRKKENLEFEKEGKLNEETKKSDHFEVKTVVTLDDSKLSNPPELFMRKKKRFSLSMIPSSLEAEANKKKLEDFLNKHSNTLDIRKPNKDFVSKELKKQKKEE
jgi:hypothetical protein